MAERSQPESLEDLLDEMLEASGGPMTDTERARADERLYGGALRRAEVRGDTTAGPETTSPRGPR